MKIFFYNLYHNGDIHFTRPFIRDIMKKTDYDEYYYLHYNDSNLMNEIPNLKFERPNMCCLKNNMFLIVNNEEIYINVHIGCYDILFGDGSDGEGFPVLYTYYRFFEYVYNKLGIKMEEENFYVPEIDYSSCDIEKIDNFRKENKNPIVLIHNGPVFSSQFSNDVDFYTIINKLSDEFPYVNFFITDKKDMINKPNIFYTSDYCRGLNEISYLSTYCEIIFGMSSGPYVFSWVKKNLMNIEKTFVCITSKLRSVIWGNRSSCKLVWINKLDYDVIYNSIKNEMKNLSSLTENDFIIRAEGGKIYITPKRDIVSDDKLNIYFYLRNDQKWKHENFIGYQNTEFWYSPFYEYNSNSYRIKLVFRTTKKVLFEVTV